MQKRIDVDGSLVSVDVYGDVDGPALVMIPGVMADAAAWAPVARHVTGWRTVAVVNRRGRYRSGPVTEAYGIEAEVRDATAVLDQFSDVRTVFGWSFGALIALHLASVIAVPHLIAYEPIMAPFGVNALPDLRAARDAGDLDASVEVALRQVTGMVDEAIATLRSEGTVWAEMRRLSVPMYDETLAINQAPVPGELAAGGDRIDLIIGQLNRGQAPYGTSFADVARHLPRASVHELDGQGHLAHLQAAQHLAALVDRLGAVTP